jgi:hypothetical protein
MWQCHTVRHPMPEQLSRPLVHRRGPIKEFIVLLKRISVLVMLVVGLVLTTFPIATSMFSKTSGVEQLTGDFRESFTPGALDQTRTDFDGVVAMSDELQTKTLPALAPALGMSPAEFDAFMAKNYPDVTDGISQLNTILPRFGSLVGGLETQAPNFRKADSIPINFLPSTVVPLLFLLPGLVLVALAGRGLVRSFRDGEERPGDVALVASAIVGVVLIGATVGLSVHAKGQAVDDMTGAFAPVFTESGAAQVRTDMNVVQAMADQLQAETLPALAKALDLSDKELATFLATNFPAVAAGVDRLDVVLPRFEALVAGVGDNVDSFAKASSIPTEDEPTTALTWWFVIPGLVLILVPAVVLLAVRLAPAARRRSLQLRQA